MRKISNRTKGDKFESRVASMLQLRKTSNSGARNDDADLSDDYIMFECKVKSSKGISIPHKEIEKVINQSTRWHKEWAFVISNAQGLETVTLSLDLFAVLYLGFQAHHKGCHRTKPV